VESEIMATKSGSGGPQFVRFFGPVLQALRELGDSARPAEVRDKVAADLNISEGKIDELLDSGTSRFDNQVAWARFYLAKSGFIDSSRRGVWSLTDKGRMANLDHREALKIFREVHSEFPRSVESTSESGTSDEALAPEDSSSGQVTNYRLELLDILQKLPPDGFERFCQRLLRESGFQDVTVTGRSGDGGIDGIGILQVNPLVSFKVLFQCKRYRGSVSPSHVRDFRGAMQGRADKGIIITTGSFTSDAKKESVRDGVPPIELLDGERLIEMLETLELGLVPVRAYQVDKKFFDEYRS
jgi:restriction system protein